MLFILFFLALLASPAVEAKDLPGPYLAKVTRVIDGDTFEARIHIWLGQEALTLVRLRGIDAPELRGKCPNESEAAKAARDHLVVLLEEGFVFLTDVGADKYGNRILANARLPSGQDIATQMLNSGYAQSAGTSRKKRC